MLFSCVVVFVQQIKCTTYQVNINASGTGPDPKHNSLWKPGNISELRSMIRLLLTFLITLPAAWSMGQVIHGTVLDKESGEPVDYADVFFDGTFLGTITDEYGVFTLDVTRYSSRSLTISAMGYYPASLSEFTAGKNYRVYLTPRVFEIEEAMVSAKSLTRERLANLKLFRKEFIGSTRYARRCYILNEKDITFNYGTDQDTLKAYASKPIRIQNLALGYEISYYLDRFEYDRHTKTVVYTGSIIFLKDLGTDPGSLTRYERRRAYAYAGSATHLFRALWAHALKNSGFIVRDYSTSEILTEEEMVFQDSTGRKYFYYPEDLRIDYYTRLSYISCLKKRVYFEPDGFFDPTGLLWGGTISEQRIADFLPYEYAPAR